MDTVTSWAWGASISISSVLHGWWRPLQTAARTLIDTLPSHVASRADPTPLDDDVSGAETSWSHPLGSLDPQQVEAESQRGGGELAEAEPAGPGGVVGSTQDRARLVERGEALGQLEEVGAQLRGAQ